MQYNLLCEAGVPGNVLHFMPGSGAGFGSFRPEDIGGKLMFHLYSTGNQPRFSSAHGPIVPLIAETGGQNAMLIDSTSLPEQVVTDVVASAFQKRTAPPALRVLFVQDDIADRIFDLRAVR